jgi:hypothetical protein
MPKSARCWTAGGWDDGACVVGTTPSSRFSPFSRFGFRITFKSWLIMGSKDQGQFAKNERGI